MGLILNDLKNVCELEHVCDYVNNRTTSSMNYISTENMLPNKGGISESTIIPPGTTIEYKIGDILISNIRPYFQKIWCADRCGGCSADVLCIRAKENTDSKYLYYLLSQQAFFDYVMSGAKGCKMPRGDKKQIMQWPVNIPAIDVQKKVVAILSSLDNKIRLNRRINDNLEEQAKALFKSWFVDFEPFKNGPFADSELGKIPQGWTIGTLSDVGDVIGGGTPSKAVSEYYTNEGIAWITPKDLSTNNCKFISRGETDISELGYKNSNAKLMPRGSILFSSRAPIGYISIAKNEICTNQGFKSIVPQKAGTCFIYYFLRNNTSKIESMASGSTFKEASGGLMKLLKVIIPTKEILTNFEKAVQPLFDMQENNEDESIRLSVLRDTLLPKLMSGELSVEEVSFD
ncbi:restriction endonuclease subunit S [Alistipes timonensis]|nr:restriction endonuclease subunit S [Alistipes timonensis]MCR2031664.1 restriction endonuclease subunit S [Alistipes timonensis]